MGKDSEKKKSASSKKSGSEKKPKSKSSKKSSGKVKNNSSSKKSGGKPPTVPQQGHQHHHRHGHRHGPNKGPSHGPAISSLSGVNQTKHSLASNIVNNTRKKKAATTTKAKAVSTRAEDSMAHRFVLKGKLPPKINDGIASPSRLLPDQMTTIYTIPNEYFDTEEEVCQFNGYEVLEQIGQGGFAVVYKARNTKTGQLCACKTVKVKDQDAILEMKNELFIMEMVENPFAIRLYLHYLVNQTLYIFMQLADAGSFGKMLEKYGALSEDDARYYFAQMCCGVAHMHARDIAHRDIKPANFLMAEHQSGRKIVLISDYGLSRVVHRNSDGSPMLYTTQCGTPAYMAPELLSGKSYNCYLADVWSLGVTLYAMLVLMTPFNVENDDYGVQSMVEGDWDWLTAEMRAPPSQGLDDLTTEMLNPNPDSRISMSKVTTHRWLAGEYKSIQQMEPPKGSSSSNKK